MVKTFHKEWFGKHGSDVLSYGGLLLCLAVFSILSRGRLWSAYNIGILIQAACVYAILSMGAVFIYSMGYMDISVGAQVGVYCIVCILVTNATGSLLMGFGAILGISVLCGLINGYVSVMLGLPSIVTSIFLNAIFGGAQMLLMEWADTNSIGIAYDMSFLKSITAMVIAIIVIAFVSIILYNYTQLGKYVRAIGANEEATKLSGVSVTRWKVLAYTFFGICIAIGALFLTARTGAAGKGTGTGYAMDIMIALLLGGMPLAGGMKSKIGSSLIGSFTYVILSNGLTLSGVDTTYVYVIKALVFLVVILFTCRKRDGILPR